VEQSLRNTPGRLPEDLGEMKGKDCSLLNEIPLSCCIREATHVHSREQYI
jgi:hypothetical protein